MIFVTRTHTQKDKNERHIGKIQGLYGEDDTSEIGLFEDYKKTVPI